MNAKPTAKQIAEVSKGLHIQYEVVEYQGVDLLLTKDRLYNAINVTYEFTNDEKVRKLGERLGIKFRRAKR